MTKLKISIIMINYNYAHYLEHALDSVVNQTVLPSEYLIIDDKSTDNSVQIIKKYEKKYSFINFHENKVNQGVHYNINLGLKISKGNYIHFFSPDDFVAPNFIQESSKLLIKYPNVGLVCSIAVFVNHNEEFHSEFPHPPSNILEYTSPKKVPQIFKKKFFIAGHTSIIKKQYLLEINGFPSKLKWHCDWFAINAIAFRYGFCYVHKRLSFLRIHPNSYSHLNKKWKNQKVIIDQLFEIIKKDEYKDIVYLFYNSEILFALPFMCLYLITHPKICFNLSNELLISFVKRIFKIKSIINFIKFLLRPVLGKPYRALKKIFFTKKRQKITF